MREIFKMGPGGDDECDCALLVGIAVDADVLDEWVSFELGLHLTQGDVFTQLELDQILLPVHNAKAACSKKKRKIQLLATDLENSCYLG